MWGYLYDIILYMKKIYFISILVLVLLISSGLAFATTKPKNLDCKLAENADNEWCDIENPVEDQDPADEEDVIVDELECDPFFTVIPKYKGYAIKYISDTKILQEILNLDNEKVLLKVDGLWGPKTDKAFRAFQKSNDLTVTGKVDDATIEFLQENYCDIVASYAVDEEE